MIASRRLLGVLSSTASSSSSAAASSTDMGNAVFQNIFTNDLPLLDLRADVEFSKGAFPTSVNIPLLDDEQRRLVGTCYKTDGPEAAFALGVELITPLKGQRVQAWKDFAEAHPNGYMYCFRGGSRSQISQQGLQEAGIDYPRVTGGYKAMRQYLIDELEQIQDLPIVMIGGRTGSGKTELVKQFEHHVDLEGLANHRGSAFGGVLTPQPTQINFENTLAIGFLKLRQSQTSPIIIEEEGKRIGQLILPASMYKSMSSRYPVIELETPMDERIERCVQDYVVDLFPSFQSMYGDRAYEELRQTHLFSLQRIRKRLPDYETTKQQVSEALDAFEATGDLAGFYEPTKSMMHLYDKYYDFQQGERESKVLFQGDMESILEWARSHEGQTCMKENTSPRQ
jgi:tRNA 2-selenouridine synthase